jgi:two-component system capsular synthesis sensor histidine kinase RcsC
LLANFDPDLVLTDIMMPNMNGYELTEALRKRGFTKSIIGVTGATMGMEAKRLIESGANQVLAKPLTVQGLETALKSINEDDAEHRGSA